MIKIDIKNWLTGVIIFILCMMAWCVLWRIENKESCKIYEDGMKICVQDLQAAPKELQ